MSEPTLEEIALLMLRRAVQRSAAYGEYFTPAGFKNDEWQLVKMIVAEEEAP